MESEFRKMSDQELHDRVKHYKGAIKKIMKGVRRNKNFEKDHLRKTKVKFSTEGKILTMKCFSNQIRVIEGILAERKIRNEFDHHHPESRDDRRNSKLSESGHVIIN